MQAEQLIKEISYPPPIKTSRRLRLILNPPPPVIAHCAATDCCNFFRVLKNRKRYCSRPCSQSQHYRNVQQNGAFAAGNARRGKNPDRHISIRVNGKQMYLHRYIVEQQLGMKLAEDEIVHHVDGNKHHNCFWKDVNDCPYPHLTDGPNLEILTGEARREHIQYHQEQMQRARKRK